MSSPQIIEYEQPLYLSSQDAEVLKNLIKNPSGFLDEYSDHAKMWMKQPGSMANWSRLAPVTYGESGIPGTLSNEWVERAAVMARIGANRSNLGRSYAFANIGAEMKDVTSNSVMSESVHFSPKDVGALASAALEARNDDLARMKEVRGENSAAPLKIKIGDSVSCVRTTLIGNGMTSGAFSVVPVTANEKFCNNCTSISASMNDAGEREIHIPVPCAMKLVGQSLLAKHAENSLYEPVKKVGIVPVSAQAVKALDQHVNTVAKDDCICAIPAASIGEAMCHEGQMSNLFVGKKQTDIGASLSDVLTGAARLFNIGAQGAFTNATEAEVREAIGAAQGRILATMPASQDPKKQPQMNASYSLFVGENFVPISAYHLESAGRSTKAARDVFDAEMHYAAHPDQHAVISAQCSDGTVIDTMLVPTATGVKVIGDHIHGGKRDGKHRKRRGHTSYASHGTDEYMGMYH